MLLYRVQDRHGIGMYTCCAWDPGWHDAGRHPPPFADAALQSGMLRRDVGTFDGWLYAFATKGQLVQWIGELWRLESLYTDGCEVVAIEAGEAITGSTQAIFWPETAQCRQAFKLSEVKQWFSQCNGRSTDQPRGSNCRLSMPLTNDGLNWMAR